MKLEVVGDGPEHASLLRMAHNLSLGGSVTFHGSIPSDEKVRELYAEADLFCLPSQQEGFGIVFLEAMASKLPIVAASAAAVPEVVSHNDVGLLVPPKNVLALTQALIKLLENTSLRHEMGERGRKRVQDYDWPQVAAKFVEVLNS